jgi:uncharacterized protein (DUF885 family)
MRVIGKIIGGLAGLIAAVIAGAAIWFWFYPVTVNNAVNKFTIEFAANTPELLTGLGAIDNTPLDFHSGKLSDYTKARDEKDRERLKKARKMMNRFDPDKLKGQEKLTWEISTWFLDDILEQASFDYSGYRVNQISGPTVDLPQFLTDIHVIKNEKSVKRYLSRLHEFGRVLSETKARVEDDRAHGVTPPDFIIDKAIGVMQSFIENGAAENALVTTLPAKLDKIENLSEEKKAAYLTEATKIVNDKIIPGYQAMIALFEDMRETATHDAGIWRIPDGEKIYAAALRSNTTTDLSADEIHEIGVSEVNRIEVEMDQILQTQGLVEGSVSDRVKSLMQDPEQQFTNTDEGRQQLLDFLDEINTEIMAEAPKFFITIPEQPLEIVRVPEYSQDSSPGGYYNPPALDGSRPGRFYINLKNTADNPRFTLPTLFYHEGVPGHHFQLSASQLIKGVPLLRKVSPFSAYSEGWALYAERIAKTDMHRYDTDPLGDLGRLQAEMFRAVRLVVDTGMHSKRWSREEAIEYMIFKTGMTEDEVTREIERYVVWPGQACAYKTGQLAILRARARAEKELGDKFDLRQFHELVLGNGAMPLGILDTVVDEWVEKKKRA